LIMGGKCLAERDKSEILPPPQKTHQAISRDPSASGPGFEPKEGVAAGLGGALPHESGVVAGEEAVQEEARAVPPQGGHDPIRGPLLPSPA